MKTIYKTVGKICLHGLRGIAIFVALIFILLLTEVLINEPAKNLANDLSDISQKLLQKAEKVGP